MKFSHSLQFNAVPEWSSKYISYTTLKKLIYSLQRESLKNQADDLESAHLVSNESTPSRDPNLVFSAALDSELNKIEAFYRSQEDYVFKSIEDLVNDMSVYENELEDSNFGISSYSRLGIKKLASNEDLGPARDAKGRVITHDAVDNQPVTTDPDTEFTQDDIDESDSELLVNHKNFSGNQKLAKSRSQDLRMKSPSLAALTTQMTSLAMPPQLVLLSESRVILRKRIIGLYTTLSELKSYVELNKTGFKKALKKFDKSLNAHLKEEYLARLPKSYPFMESTMSAINDRLESLVKLFADICGQEDLDVAKSELSIHLRDHVVWERNTVWRDMITLERKLQAANSNFRASSKQGEKMMSERSSFNLSFTNPTLVKLAVIVGVTVILLNFSPFDDISQKNCFALLVCASLLWASETIPLFVTSLLIPMLVVSLGVLKYPDGSPMSTTESSKYILSSMWNSVILLLLGGFTLAASLTKYHIAKLMSTWVLSKAGTNPSVVLFTIMFIALFSSMWVSNVAAPVLCFSLIQPLLRTLPKDSKFISPLILGIALASNIGGMASPIASPQNMIAIGAMDPPPSWGQWFVIALPVCLLSLILIWLFLLATFDCRKLTTQLVSIKTIDEKFSGVQWYIAAVSIFTIILWCFASKLEGIFGEMGIIALIPIILFYGPGLLTTEDFNNYPWNIVVLAMGGTALGKAVASSGLLSTIAVAIEKEVEGFSLFGVTLTFGLLILVMATFVSHTVAALIVIPLVSEIGDNMKDSHSRLLIMASALICSAAMGLPTSGFPNVTAICMTDEFGKPYLTVNTFITRGVPSSFLAYLVIVGVGYGTMRVINF